MRKRGDRIGARLRAASAEPPEENDVLVISGKEEQLDALELAIEELQKT